MHSCLDPGTAVIHFWLPGGVCRKRSRCYYSRAPKPILALLLLVALYSQCGDQKLIISN